MFRYSSGRKLVMKKSHVIPTSVNKRLISTLMSTRKVDPNENKNFALKSTTDFASRSGDVFGKLQSLEKSHENWISENDTLECFEDSDEHGLSQTFLKPQNKPDTPIKAKFEIVPTTSDAVKKPDSEVVFKKPWPARSLKRKASSSPNFGKQPKKWTKYSLEDVPVSSDATNAAAAFQFLNELKSRKEQNTDVDADDNTDKIVFKKPKQKERSAVSHVKARVVVAVEDDFSESCSGEEEECKTSGNVMLAHLEEE